MSSTFDFCKLPPLKSLRGFESTARLLTFRKAAEELNLSHPAISHQVRMLEESLGTKLFIREGRYNVLTEEGAQLYAVVREVLESLTTVSESIRSTSSHQSLRIQTYISVSIRWLSHRLPRFRALYPELDLHLISSIQEQHFDEANADIGLLFCRTPPVSPLVWFPLMPSRLFPVCSPGLMVDGVGPLKPEDLLAFPLLTITSEAWQWQDWFESAGVVPDQIDSSISVDSTCIALEMAMDGEGVALVNGPFADNDLRVGRLVQPVAHCADALGEWGLVCREGVVEQEAVRNFIDWLQGDLSA